MTSLQDRTIYYKIITQSDLINFTIAKEGSNFTYNQIVLHPLIGTLVKYGTTGKLEPYLAESWNISKDRKVWLFKFRDGLTAEDGSLITAKAFHDSLLKSLREYSKKSSAIIFDYLIGWNEFASGKTTNISGITVEDNSIQFSFEKHPDDFLEILRNPFFGFWRTDNSNQIVSTSSYKINQIKEDEIILEIRDNWFNSSEDSFKKIIFSFGDLSILDNSLAKNTIIQAPLNINTSNLPNKSYWIARPPTISESFVLSPYKSGFFANIENRRIFQNRVKSLIKSHFLYPSAVSEIRNPLEDLNYKANKKGTLTFIVERINYSEAELANLKKIINFALEGSKQDFILIPRNLKNSEFLKSVQSNSVYDARIASVDSGAYPTYSVIKMMFCTKLGITFPGHEEEFCKLIEENLSIGKEISQDFIDKFNLAIHHKAILIPFAHHSSNLLVSDSLDPQFLPATTVYPMFEKLREK